MLAWFWVERSWMDDSMFGVLMWNEDSDAKAVRALRSSDSDGNNDMWQGRIRWTGLEAISG